MYWHGCNYPWSTDGAVVYYGLDFGANIWGSHLGVSTRCDAVRRDFADMAGIEFLLIDENTRLEEFKKELRWNDLYYHMAAGL